MDSTTNDFDNNSVMFNSYRVQQIRYQNNAVLFSKKKIYEYHSEEENLRIWIFFDESLLTIFLN